MLQLGFRQSVC